MKKGILVFIIIAIINTIVAFGETPAITASVEKVGEKVTVTGTISSGAGKNILIYLTDSNGDITYIDQIKSGVGGSFTTTFSLSDKAIDGVYNLGVGGTDVETPARLTFTYTKDDEPNPDPNPEPEPDPTPTPEPDPTPTPEPEKATITASVENVGKSVTVTGTISSGAGKNILIYLTDLNGDIAYIDQIKSGVGGSFTTTFSLSDKAIEGVYNLGVGGTNVETPARLTFIYENDSVLTKRNKFMDADIDVSINGYVPTVTGTITWTEGKTITIAVIDRRDMISTFYEVLPSEIGVYSFYYPFTSLLNAKTYEVFVSCTEDGENLAAMSFIVDSSLLAVDVEGTVNTADNVDIEARFQSVNTNLIDESVIFNGEKTISATIPNLVSNATFHLTAQGYETLPVKAQISAEVNFTDTEIQIDGSIGIADKRDLTISLIYPDGQLSEEINKKTEADGSFSITINHAEPLAEGIYKLLIKEEYSDENYTEYFSYAKEIPEEDVKNEENLSLYNALKKARPMLDAENTGIITISELNSITGALDLSNSNIRNIKGLQCCKNITELYLSNNMISDLSPISGLLNLRTLYADSNQLYDLVVVAPNIKVLNVERNYLDSLKSVVVLNDIEILYADNNNIYSTEFIENKRKLKILTLNNNNISEISAIKDADSIQHLDISNNNITNIDGLNGKNKLRDLRASNNNISDIYKLPISLVYDYLSFNGNRLTIDQITEFCVFNLLFYPQK